MSLAADGQGRQDGRRDVQGDGDPNVFLLSDDSGKEFGTVHLAYVSRTGDCGTLFLIVGDDTVQYDKRSRVPAFFGDSQNGQDS